jgi:hypothetical protein
MSHVVRRAGDVAWAARTLVRLGRPRHLLLFGSALGDDLLCTAVLRELRARGGRGLWMMTTHPRLFDLNTDADQLVPWDYRYYALAVKTGARVTVPVYAAYDERTDHSAIPSRHIIGAMCADAGIGGRVALRPYLDLTDAERRGGRVARRQVAIQSSGLAARWAMPNKEWFPERYQAVVDALRDEFDFVQLGSPNDPPLDGCTDLRGRTSLRETAAVLSQSLAFVGQVGFLMHLARAVETRGVVVYGGREFPEQSGYPCNVNLVTRTPCAPCWRWRTCDFDRTCMRQIGAEDVVRGVHEAAGRRGEPLEVAYDDLPPPGPPPPPADFPEID